MTTTVTLTARQRAAGQPVKVRVAGRLSGADDWADAGDLGWGVTTSATPPANLAALTYSEHSGWGSDTFDRMRAQAMQRVSGGTVAGELTEQPIASAVADDTLPIDTHVVVGRYLWAFWLSSGGVNFLALSTPYLIT